MNKAFSEISRGKDLKRYEVKMVYNGLCLPEVKSWILGHSQLFREAYPPRQVNNIYFDTHDLDFRDAHYQGVFNRFKIRYRWYHKSWIASKGQLEIKLKYGNLGNKEVFPIEGMIDIPTLTWSQIYELLRSELDLEFQYLFDPIIAILINNYQREYYVNADGNVRITLDTQHQCFDQSFGSKPNISHIMPMRSDLVLEFKANKSHYLEIADILEEFPLYSSAHSKYMAGTENTLI